jgi:hypothetical protein
MFDVFYSGVKPNLFAHEQSAESIEQAQELSRTRYFWWVNYLTDYTGFDFLWEPVPWQNNYVHAWPSQWDQYHGCCLVPKQADTTQYHMHDRVLPARVIQDNFRTLIACDFDYTWAPHPWEPPYIYVFGNQWWPAVKQPTVEYHVPGATERKYMFYPRAELTVDMTNWSVPDTVDTTTFDFSWRPDPGDPPYIYQFGTQHQRTGGPQYLVPGAADTKYVDQIKIKTGRVATAVYEIDHMDGNAGQIANTTKTVRYFDNYLDTLKRIAKSIPDEHEFVWICSSICDYSTFDFTWHSEVWQATMLHVFPSDGEKFGDTFFMHVPTFKYRSERLQLLDWYDLNFMDRSVPRRPLPVITHTYDTHVEAVKNLEFSGPLAIYTTQDTVIDNIPAVPLWREKTKTVVPLSPGASVAIIPKVAVPYIKKQLYDYPNILRTQRHMYTDTPLDIVFIDNGEPNAEQNWIALQLSTACAKNSIHRSSGVNGRVAAYQAAARLSTTPWFFAVFAKLEISSSFDWLWQPDRLQEPKHYIFHAFNPVNGLEYGHQAMIAYNRSLVLANTGQGLDFTLDDAHEVVPIRSGTAEYDYTPWMAWRTAFREVLKLKASKDVESQYRLNKWLTTARDKDNRYGRYSIYGAEDAVEYYDAVGGAMEELKKSYDWAWLASYALIKRNLPPEK